MVLLLMSSSSSYKALAAASTMSSSMSNDFLCAWLDQGLPHLAAYLIKVPIPPFFVGIILTHEAVLSRWMHGGRVLLVCSAKATRQLECGNSAWGAWLAVNQINFSLKFSLCVNVVCKNFDATFSVSTKKHPDAMERVVQTPNKVHPPSLNTIPHLWYAFWLQKSDGGNWN